MSRVGDENGTLNRQSLDPFFQFWVEKQLEESVAGMAHLIGRLVHVPRAVFAADIKRGLSQAPPNGTHWVAEVLQYDSSGTSVPFTLQLEVHDEQGKLDSEEQDISPQQLEKWIVLLDNLMNTLQRASASPLSLMRTAS